MKVKHKLERLADGWRCFGSTRSQRLVEFRGCAALFLILALHWSLVNVAARTGSERRVGKKVSFASAHGQQVRTSDATLVKKVWQRLLVAANTHQRNYSQQSRQYVWPPSFALEDNAKINASASLWYQHSVKAQRCPIDGKPICASHQLRSEPGGNGTVWILPSEKRTGKFFPHVVLYQGILDEVVVGDPNRLALIIGHELAHILLGHVLPVSLGRTGQTPTLRVIFTAEQEHDADLLGMKMALQAGYSIEGARECWLKLDDLGLTYSSFHERGADHPSWSDRLALLDKQKEELWKSMSAFENGVTFLAVQQYSAAEECFDRVVKDFPDSHEAWANLGHARLMQYLDAFDEKDLANFDVGQIMLGSFYRRPETLRARIRGIDAELWKRSVEALRKALDLKSDLALAKGNLGVAYLLSPTGKNVSEAIRYFEGAATAMRDDLELAADKGLRKYYLAALLNNTAVALLAEGRADLANRRLQQAENLFAENPRPLAFAYNRALLLATSSDLAQRRDSLSHLQIYLREMSPTSIWWGIGYQRYAKMGRELGITTTSREELRRTARPRAELRTVASVEIKKGLLVTLSEPIENVKAKLGSAPGIPVARGTSLVRLTYADHGVELLAGRRVMAIFLRGKNAPPLRVRGSGMGSKSSFVRVGMTAREVENALSRNYKLAPLDDPWVQYHFYPEVGVAVLYGENGLVKELVVSQIVVDNS